MTPVSGPIPKSKRTRNRVRLLQEGTRLLMMKDGWALDADPECFAWPMGISRRWKCCIGCWRRGWSWNPTFWRFPIRNGEGAADGDGGRDGGADVSSYGS